MSECVNVVKRSEFVSVDQRTELYKSELLLIIDELILYSDNVCYQMTNVFLAKCLLLLFVVLLSSRNS